MPVTRITLSTAMRARDVSRPRDEDFVEAAERDDPAMKHPQPPTPKPLSPTQAEPPQPRRRRRRR